MKTIKIISVLRVAFGRLVLAAIATIIILFALRQYALCDFAQGYWYVGAMLIVAYAALTFGGDFLNKRFLCLGQ